MTHQGPMIPNVGSDFPPALILLARGVAPGIRGEYSLAPDLKHMLESCRLHALEGGRVHQSRQRRVN